MSMTEKLAYLKKLRHLTTEEIAQQSGIPIGTLNKIFSGQTRYPAVQHMDQLARALGTPISYLLDDALPAECCVTVADDEGLLLLSPEEIRFLMKYRGLDARSRRTLWTMAELLHSAPGRLAGNFSARQIFCYIPAGDGADIPFSFRPIRISETDDAARTADFTVLVSDGSMEPLYSAGDVLLCKKEPAGRHGYGLYLLNRRPYLRRLCRRRGITNLVAPNLDFRDIVVGMEDTLECVGSITGVAQCFKWGQPR